MNERMEIFPDEYVRGDSCYAVVIGHNSRGSYLRLDNGQKAFAYNAGNVWKGVRIICSIVASATAEKNTLARLESICNIYETYA